MATVNRQLKFSGTVLSTPAAATILINGVEMYSGQIGIGQPLDQIVDLLELDWENDYQGQQSTTLAITISLTSGVASFGIVWADQPAGSPYAPWIYPDNLTNDGRTQILINGLPPEWPATPVDPMPGGDEANPIWNGWCFELSAGETMTFEYEALSYILS